MDLTADEGTLDVTPFPNFSALLQACTPFAKLTGGRYTRELFDDIRGDDCFGDSVRMAAMPVVVEFTEKIARGGATLESLLQEFRVAATMVLREAVFVSMCATCRSLELWPAKAGLSPDDMTYQDMSDPLECIAQRLYNYVQVLAQGGEDKLQKRKMRAASFVVEFGVAHGIAETPCDAVAERMLMEFLKRVKEWGERVQKTELKPCLEPLPPSMRQKAELWWKENWKGVFLGAGIVLGAGLIGAALAVASAGSNGGYSDGKDANSSCKDSEDVSSSAR